MGYILHLQEELSKYHALQRKCFEWVGKQTAMNTSLTQELELQTAKKAKMVTVPLLLLFAALGPWPAHACCPVAEYNQARIEPGSHAVA
jgi:hypothetical protein